MPQVLTVSSADIKQPKSLPKERLYKQEIEFLQLLRLSNPSLWTEEVIRKKTEECYKRTFGGD